MLRRNSQRRRLNRLRRFLIGLVGILGVTAVLLFTLVPTFVAQRLNRVTVAPPYSTSPMAQNLHQSLSVVDLHADSLLWNRNLLQRSNYGHVDIPRLLDGNVTLQVFAVVTKVPQDLNIERNDHQSDDIIKLAIVQRWPIRTWFSLNQRALYQARQLNTIVARSQGQFRLIKTENDLSTYLDQRQQNPDLAAGLLGLEGAHALEGNLKNLDQLFEAGFRMLGLTHFFDNEVGGSVHGVTKGGLTAFGKQVVQRAEQLHMVIDLAHASPQLMTEVLTQVTQPIVVSHTGVKATCDNTRNLSDDQIRQIAQTEGVIGIGFWQIAVCGEDAAAIARSIRYVADLVGVEYVGLGSDFDGGVKTPFDVTGMAQITEALLAEGFTEKDIRKIMGLNTLRVLKTVLPPV